jgi:serine/threonine protein kinase
MADTPDMSNHDEPKNEIRVSPNEEKNSKNLPRDYGGYRLLELIGTGGSSVVYRAKKIGLETPKDVALKKPHPNAALDSKFKMLIEREGPKTYKLNHSNILSATDWSSNSDEPYLVTPYMAKGSMVDQIKFHKGKIPIPMIVKWSIQAAKALDYIHHHEVNIFHRDIKPVVEVTRTDPLEKLVWANRKDSDDERNKILN